MRFPFGVLAVLNRSELDYRKSYLGITKTPFLGVSWIIVNHIQELYSGLVAVSLFG
jgi:hypothetical protein